MLTKTGTTEAKPPGASEGAAKTATRGGTQRFMTPQTPSSERWLVAVSARFILKALVLILVLAATVALAGAAQAGHHEDLGEPQVTDPEGDATDYSSDYVVNQAAYNCNAAQTVRQVCSQVADPAASNTPAAGGVPADPSLDILSVTLSETPRALEVTLEVAKLEEDWEGYSDEGPFGERFARWDVSWYNDEDGGCVERVYTHGDFGFYTNSEDHCGDSGGSPEDPWERGCTYAYWCWTLIDLDVETGSPGYITWTVPRDSLVNGEKDWTDHDVWGQTVLFPGHLLSGGSVFGWGVDAMGQSEGGHVQGWASEIDRTDPGTPFTFQSMQDPWPDPDPEAHLAQGWGSGDAEILSADLEDTPETLRFTATVSRLQEGSLDVNYDVNLGMPSRHVLSVSISEAADEDGYEAYARYFEPGTGLLLHDDQHWVVVPVDLEITPGEPGTIAVTVDRTLLPPISEGDLARYYIWFTYDPDWGTWAGVHPDEADVGVAAGSARTSYFDEGDFGGAGAPLFRFQHDTPSQAPDTFLRISDAPGDTTQPSNDPMFNQEERFDITYIEARAESEEETHLTIGIHDLSRATVPQGYDAMFYALAVEVDNRNTMIGYYKAADSFAGPHPGNFLCAPDITVLTESQRDPAEAVWTLISGLVSAPPETNGGSGGPGAITFYVPNACFGTDAIDEEGTALNLDRFAAGTYLVRSGAAGAIQGSVYEIDTSEADGPVSLDIPTDDELLEQAWYAAPLGVESFWDMLGLSLAVALATGGAAVKLRSRRRDKAALADAKAREDRDVYREALERAVATDVDPATDTVLQALRNRLSISEREHAMLELEARTAAGLGVTGLAEGQLFLGKYRIEEQLGEGGFARTYLARDEKLARDVVLKVARWGNPKEMQRALREARIIARAEHENIVRVFDVEEVADHVVLVLEHVPGGSLEERLQNGPLATDDALSVVEDVLAALEAAHGEGIVHRDIKPANILLTRDGHAKLVDFGIAQAPEGSGTITGGTLSGQGAGTVRYMAPEQARGEATDERTDVYSTGAVLYEMLTGESCIPLENLPEFDARNAIMDEAPRLPLKGAPEGVNEALEKALAKDPDARLQRAQEMRGLLEDVDDAPGPVEGRPIAPRKRHGVEGPSASSNIG